VDLDYGLSALVARLTGARSHHCWKNAWQALIELPHLFLEGRYVEGWAVYERGNQVCVLEHGWDALPAGRGIVDPSIVLLVGMRHPVAYFPGLAYTWTETLAFGGQPLPRALETSGGDDGLHPDYRRAFEQAMAYATTLVDTAPVPMEVSLRRAAPPPELPATVEAERLEYTVRIVSSSTLWSSPTWRAAAESTGESEAE
jgi:hypothetical protein